MPIFLLNPIRAHHYDTSLKNITLPPPSQSILKAILEKPEVNENVKVDIPFCPFVVEKIDKFNEHQNITIEDPVNKEIAEKHAIVMIVKRRKKMKKHKLKKLRIKMKFEWAKVRQRRELKKEKAFQLEMSTKVKEGERFDAEKYVEQKLHLLHLEKQPFFGVGAPEWYIKERLDRIEKLKADKVARKERRQSLPSMYVKDYDV